MDKGLNCRKHFKKYEEMVRKNKFIWKNFLNETHATPN